MAVQLSPLIFDDWVRRQKEVRKVLPDKEKILKCESDEDAPSLIFEEGSNLLYFSCELSGRILETDGTVATPYWVLSKENADLRGTLRAIVTEKHRDVWKANKEAMKIIGAKVVAPSRSQKSIIVELVLGESV